MAADQGKPDLVIHDLGGTAFPRVQDIWSGFKQFNLIGVFHGANAFSDAIDLADLVLSDGGGNPMTLDIPDISELDSNISVAPSAEQDRALNLSYQPGRKNRVEFDLGVTRVGQTLGSYNRTPTTPTASGSGPIQLTDGTTTIDLVKGVTVDRYVGRPNDVTRKHPNQDYPNYEPKRKVLNDEFEIQLTFNDNAVQQTRDIADLFNQRLGRTGLTLSFNGKFGLGEFNVVPSGTQGLRHIRESGKNGVSIIPNIALRRITV